MYVQFMLLYVILKNPLDLSPFTENVKLNSSEKECLWEE